MAAMVLSEKRQQRVHELIDTIFLSSFTFSSVDAISKDACEILDAHYFGFVLFPLNRENTVPLLVTNNPPAFISEYANVYQKDPITKAMIETGKEAVLQRIPDWNKGVNRDYLEPLNKIRPACDGIYIPMRTESGLFRGYWAIARAGLHSSPFSDNDLEIFQFLAGFMDEAFDRSFRDFAYVEYTAFLDSNGHVVQAGEVISQVFHNIFGFGRNSGNFEKAVYLNLFLTRFRMFQDHPYHHGQDRVNINFRGKNFKFRFSLIDDGMIPVELRGNRIIKVFLLPDSDSRSIDTPNSINFSCREKEVLRGIFLGQMNKEIAKNLGIDESTVKRYTHNIFEKTGFHSRTELVLGLPQMLTIDFGGD